MLHPYAFLTAAIVSAPLLAPLWRLFFGDWSHFGYDAGLRPVPEQWPDIKRQLSTHLSSIVATFVVDLLGFLLAYVAIVAILYHALVWAAAFFLAD